MYPIPGSNQRGRRRKKKGEVYKRWILNFGFYGGYRWLLPAFTAMSERAGGREGERRNE